MNKRSARRAALRGKPVALAVAAAFLPFGQALALPTDPQVVHGQVSVTTSGSTMNINHTTPAPNPRGIVNWRGFSIELGETVNITQAASAVLLNRVNPGGDPSRIFGSLNAQGHVFLVNNAGVLFGPSASVSAGALVASTLSISNDDFLAGRYVFSNPGNAGSVVNQGSIVTAGGYTALIGPQVQNDGVILARTGSVALAAGDRVSLDLIGDGLISVSVDQDAANASIVNTGRIEADGGTVLLKASRANALLDTVINTSGVIRALSLAERNGEIVLEAGPNGGITVTGEMQAAQVSIYGGSFRLQQQMPDPGHLNGYIAADHANVDVAADMTVDGGQIQTQSGQNISARTLTVRAQDGEFATLNNQSGSQVITVTDGMRIETATGGSASVSNGSGEQRIHASGAGVEVVRNVDGGTAILGKPFVFGVPATDSQTITTSRLYVERGSVQAGRQDLRVGGDLSVQNAAITSGADQTVAVIGGSIDVRDGQIFSGIASGGSQTISVTDGDHINVNGAIFSASISASGGTQTVSITGSGANAINLGSAGARGSSNISGASQTITAGANGELGRIDIFGADAPQTFVGISSNFAPGAGNTQSVSTSGALTIQGGNSPFQNPLPNPPGGLSTSSAGIFHNSNGQQAINAGALVQQGGAGLNNFANIGSGSGGAQQITAGAITLQGGPSGTNNGAFITTSGGDQNVTVPGGTITVAGGVGGSANRAGIITNANQTISGDPLVGNHPDIVLRGGGGSNNSAVIQATSTDPAKLQTIKARSIQLRGGSGDGASVSFNAVRQNISTTTGNVSLQAGDGLNAGVRIGGLGGTNPSSTNLTLTVAGDLLMSGGAGDGVSLASTSLAPFTQANNITVSAGGDIILTAGTGGGARIGANASANPVNPGSITVTAGGSMNVGAGTGIRASGPITLTANSLTNDGAITNGGGASTANVILIANAFDLDTGNIQGGNAAVFLRPRDGTRSFGIESAGDTTLTNADLARINTTNFVGFGSGTGTNFTGNLTIGENAQVDGGSKSLVFFRSLGAGGTTTVGAHGVRSSGDVIVAAGGGAIVSHGGIVAGDEIQLRATQGIGSAGARVNTAANALTVGTNGNAFVSEADDVTMRLIVLNVGGNTALNTTNTGTGGVLDLAVAGSLTVAGSASSGGAMTISSGGALNVTGSGTQDAILSSNGGQTITAQSVNVTAQDGRLGQIVNHVSGEQTITTGALSANGGSALTYPNVSGIVQNAGGAQTINASSVLVQGTDAGANNGIFIRAAAGNQTLNVSGDITIAAGAGGEAWIQGSAAGQQTIHAHNITMTNAQGGINSFAALQAGHQEVRASGDVRLTGGATGGTQGGVRMGGLRNAVVVTPTDLELYVDGDVVLTGGSAPNNFAGIGSTGAFGVANDIYIEAGGVILNSSAASVARIGHGTMPGGGAIEIRADRGIELNGAPAQPALIQTLGNVTLEAASISQNFNGFIRADTLTTATSGVTNLAGPNAIARFNGTSGGALTLVDGGALQVTGITTTNDAITVTTGSLTNSGTITNGGAANSANMIFNADAFSLAGGTINAGNAAVILRPRTGTNSFGIESAGMTMLRNADLAKINTTNSVVLGSGMGTTFTGAMTIGENAPVDGGAKSLAFFRSSNPGNDITIGRHGVTTSGDVIISAGGGAIRSNGGTVRGDEVQLRATQGIGAPGASVQTAANALAMNNFGPAGAFAVEADAVDLRTLNLSVGGIANNFGNFVGGVGVYDLVAGGSVSVSGPIQAGMVLLDSTSGSITEVGAGAIVANTLATRSAGSTILGGANNVAMFSASSGGEVNLTNTGALTVSGLNAGGAATLNNTGNVTVAGAWTAGGTSTINVASDIVIDAVLTSPDVVLNAGGGSIVEVGTGAIVADTLTTIAGGATTLAGENRVANYNGISGADLFLFNRGALDVNNLSAANANLSSDGTVTLSGSWSTVGRTTLTASGPGSSLVEAPGGFIQAGGGADLFVQGSIDLNGPNQITGAVSALAMQGDIRLTNVGDVNFTGSAFLGSMDLVNTGALDFSGFASIGAPSHINVTNTGALNVRALSGSDTTVTSHGPMTVSGFWNSTGATSITTTGTRSDLTVTSSVNSSGPMSVNVEGALTVVASGLQVPPPPPAGLPPLPPAPQTAGLTSFGGQEITAGSIHVLANDGGFAFINNHGAGNQNIAATSGRLSILSSGDAGSSHPASSAQISNSGTGFQTISISGALTVAAQGAQPAPPPPPGLPPVLSAPQFAQLISFGGQHITAQSVQVSAEDGALAFINNQVGSDPIPIGNPAAGNQTIVVSGGGIDIRSSGGAAFLGAAQIGNFSFGDQTITGNQTVTVSGGGGLNLFSAGGSASISNSAFNSQGFTKPGGSQTIAVSGGGSIDVQSSAPSSFASISQNAVGAAQTVSVTDGDHIRVNGAGGSAGIGSSGSQTISITGAATNNAIIVGSTGGRGFSTINGARQTITAGRDGELGRIDIFGADAPATFTGISTSFAPGAGNTQTISTSGHITVQGGNAPFQNVVGMPPVTTTSNAGIFHNSNGQQAISAGGVVLRGGAGVNSGAFIGSNAGGDQYVSADAISITGGAAGSGNRAGINTNANQTISGTPAITLTGGAGSGAGGSNNAFIIGGGPGRTQTIDAQSIELLSGADNSATILAAKQMISTVGDLRLTGNAGDGVSGGARIGGFGGAAPGATDVTLRVGGNLLMSAGGMNNSANIGSALPPPGVAPTPHLVDIRAGGDVIVQASEKTGARIGTSFLAPTAATGNISITAGRSIQFHGLNGDIGPAVIRTASDVALVAGTTITQTGSGRVLAGGLTTTSGGNTSLTGPNQVPSYNGTSGGSLILNNDVALNITNLSANGDATLTNTGAVSLSGAWRSANATILVDGAAPTVSEAGAGSIETNTLAVNASDGITLGGANRVSRLHARTFTGDFVFNNTGALEIVEVDVDDVTFTNHGAVTVNGLWNSSASSITTSGAGADLTVNNSIISAVGPMDVNVAGALIVNASSSQAGLHAFGTGAAQTINAGALTLVGQNGQSADVTLFGSGVPGADGAQALNVTDVLRVEGRGGVFQRGTGTQAISASDVTLVAGASGSGNGAFINSTAGGDQTVTVTGDLRITGGAGGTGNRAGLVANGKQTIEGNPSIILTGGAGGAAGTASNNVFIQGSTEDSDAKRQKIDAASIQITSGLGADAAATINAARQVIATTGNVSVLGSAGTGPRNGARIGGVGGDVLGPTNLNLSVGGNLLLSGGTVNGAALGSSGASTQANTITVTAATGDIVLESLGGGARIGASGQADPVNPGEIRVTAGGSLHVGAGTAIRASGPVLPTMIPPTAITLTANSLTNDGTISNGGGASTANMILNANAFDLDGGNIRGGNAAVILRPRTGTNSFGIESAGMTTLRNADLAKINTSNFVVLGSGMGTTFTGAMTIGENAPVDGGAKSLAFFRSSAPGADVTIGRHGVTTSGDVIISAGGGAIRSNGGTVRGDEVQLRATQGIGAPGASVQTAANALAMNNFGPAGAFAVEADAVDLRTINLNVGGIANNFGNFVGAGGPYELSAGGPVLVSGPIQAGSVLLQSNSGSITEVGTGAVLANSLTTLSAGDTTLTGPNQIARFNATSTAGSVNLNNTGVLEVTGMAVYNDATITNIGDVTVTGAWTAGGTSTITVGSDIVLNAAMVSRDVVLAANDGDIVQTASGSITADSLNMEASGEIRLAGSNDVGAFSAAANGMTVTSMMTFDTVNLDVVGSLWLLGGATPGSAAQISADGLIDISVGGDLRLAGGSGEGAFARILGYSDINLTVGGLLTLNAGTAKDSWARIQLDSRDSVINLHFTNPEIPGARYFVNGVEGLLRDGHTGFLADNGVAAPDHQLLIRYGAE